MSERERTREAPLVKEICKNRTQIRQFGLETQGTIPYSRKHSGTKIQVLLPFRPPKHEQPPSTCRPQRQKLVGVSFGGGNSTTTVDGWLAAYPLATGFGKPRCSSELILLHQECFRGNINGHICSSKSNMLRNPWSTL